MGLLNWSSHKETLEESLKLLNEVPEGEIVKFLQDILDALFNILVSLLNFLIFCINFKYKFFYFKVENDVPHKYDELVFTCLIRLIEIVSDLKYQHFQSVLDLYINESFSATLAYR